MGTSLSLSYIQAYEYHVDAIIKDYNENGRCELQLAKEGFFRFVSSWGFPKGTPYRESFSKGYAYGKHMAKLSITCKQSWIF